MNRPAMVLAVQWRAPHLLLMLLEEKRRAWAEVDRLAAVLPSGAAAAPEAVREFLGRCLGRKPRVVLVLAREQYAVAGLELPAGTPSETEGMLEFRLSGLLPVDASEAAWTWMDLGAAGEGTAAVEVAWTPRTRLMAVMDELRPLGIVCHAIQPSVRLLRRQAGSGAGAVRVIGPSGTEAHRWEAGAASVGRGVAARPGAPPPELLLPGSADATWRSIGSASEEGAFEVLRLAAETASDDAGMMPRDLQQASARRASRRLLLRLGVASLVLVLALAGNLAAWNASLTRQLEERQAEIARLRPAVRSVETVQERVRILNEQVEYVISPLEVLQTLNGILESEGTKLDGLYFDALRYGSDGYTVVEGHSLNDITPWLLAEAVTRNGRMEVATSPQVQFRSLGAARSIRFSLGLRPATRRPGS